MGTFHMADSSETFVNIYRWSAGYSAHALTKHSQTNSGFLYTVSDNSKKKQREQLLKEKVN